MREPSLPVSPLDPAMVTMTPSGPYLWAQRTSLPSTQVCCDQLNLVSFLHQPACHHNYVLQTIFETLLKGEHCV
jgi:hypothetical protein